MNGIHWPRILQESGFTRKLLTQSEIFWVVSPSMLTFYPEISGLRHFVVHHANYETLWRLQKKLHQEQPSEICSLGGGKTLDLTKLAIRLGTLEETSQSALKKRSWVPQEQNNQLREVPLTVIPTTAGSGSEVSEIAVLTIDRCKIPLYHALMLPERVIVDVEPLQHASDRVLWNGIWDTFVHALESVVSPLATPITKRLSHDALRSSIRIINKFTEMGSLLESELVEAQYNSLLAGKSQSVASVGLTHALAHQTELTGLWHGEACALCLPHVVAFNTKRAEKLYEQLSTDLGFHSNKELIDWISERVAATIGKWEGITLNEKERSLIVSNIMRDPCYRTNPVYISRSDLSEWLGRWFYA